MSVAKSLFIAKAYLESNKEGGGVVAFEFGAGSWSRQPGTVWREYSFGTSKIQVPAVVVWSWASYFTCLSFSLSIPKVELVIPLL